MSIKQDWRKNNSTDESYQILKKLATIFFEIFKESVNNETFSNLSVDCIYGFSNIKLRKIC